MTSGSFINTLMGGTRGAPEPEVGMGATMLSWSDRDPYTIIKVTPYKSGPNKGLAREIVVQEDDSTRTDSNGMSDSQSYTFTPNPNGRTRVVRRRKDGSFRTPGGTQFRIGSRDRYYDYSF
jgi:hypothetical protein